MWYILQIFIIIWLTNLYLTQLAPHALLGHIVLFAVLMSYAITWVLGRLIDLLLYYPLRRQNRRTGGLPIKSRSRRLGIHH
jgi:hypothetical protein